MSLVGVVFSLFLSVFMIIANYMACQVSFELLGYDRKPLYADKLVGPFFGAFVSQATLTHLYAMVVAVAVFVGLFMAFRILVHILELLKDRKVYLNQQDRENAQVIVQMILWELLDLALLAAPLGYALYWDIELFRYRSIAWAAGIEDAPKATGLGNWSLQLQEKSSLWAWSLTQIGAGGYIGVTVLACMGFEYSVRKTNENWSRLSNSLEDIFGATVPAQESAGFFYGYDMDGRPGPSTIPILRLPMM